MSDSIVINVNLTTNPITVAFGAPASAVTVTFQTARDAYQLAVVDGFVGSRAEWNAAHFGQDGDDGREIEVRNSGTFVQWRYVGDALWTDLIALGDITGADGEDGADSTVPGPPGDPIELQAAGGFIQWKFVSEDGTAWRNLVALSAITGPQGTPGTDATVNASNIAGVITGSAEKTTPVDADAMAITDGEAAGALKRLTFANLWTWIAGKVAAAAFTFAQNQIFNGTANRMPNQEAATGDAVLTRDLGNSRHGVKTILNADRSFTSDTVLKSVMLADGTTKLGVPVVANENGSFEVMLQLNDLNGNCNYRFSIVGPSGCAGRWAIVVRRDVSNTSGNWATAIGSSVGYMTVLGGNDHYAHIVGTFQNGSTAGTIEIQMAQQTTTVNTMTVKKGSIFRKK